MICVTDDYVGIGRDELGVAGGHTLPVGDDAQAVGGQRQHIVGAVDHESRSAEGPDRHRLDDDLGPTPAGSPMLRATTGRGSLLGFRPSMLVSVGARFGDELVLYDACMQSHRPNRPTCCSACSWRSGSSVCSRGAAMESELGGDIVPPAAALVRRHLRALRDERFGPAGQMTYVRQRLSPSRSASRCGLVDR